MRKEFKIRVIGISIFLSLFLILYSCDNDSKLDFSNSWIEYYIYDDYLDSSGERVNTDTITVSINDEFIIRIKTQSNDGSKPKVYKQIGEGELVDITNIPEEATLESDYYDECGYRQINKIHVELNKTVYSAGQLIKYITRIGSLNGDIQRELNLAIK